jgi:hypothetical protein
VSQAVQEQKKKGTVEQELKKLLEGEFTEEKAARVLDMVITPEGGSDDSMSAVIQELMNEKNIEMKSDLHPNQIVAITKAFWFAFHYRSPTLLMYLNKLLKLLVSKDRLGRKELAGVLAATLQYRLELAKAEKKVEV